MNKYTIAFDVGGHFVKAVVLRNRGEVCEETYAIYPSNAHESRERLIEYFVDLIRQQTAKIMDKYFQVVGIGYAFPGPFDYPNGISYIRGVQKFESLYGANLRVEIQRQMMAKSDLAAKFVTDCPIVFENDANLFALGEHLVGKAKQFRRAICITIGTGAGSAFLEQGKLIQDGEGIPKNGWIYADAFHESIVDDFISKRGVLKVAKEYGMSNDLDVGDIANLARLGDETSRRVFVRFGELLGEMLNPYVESFGPDGIVIGGQISKSHDFFSPGLKHAFEHPNVTIEYSNDTSRSTFAGVYTLLQHTEVQA